MNYKSNYIINRIWKDFRIHFIFILISVLVICKYSEAPVVIDLLYSIFQRPSEGTSLYDLCRVLEGLCISYLAGLIFYLIVTYIPDWKTEQQTLNNAESNIQNIQIWMNRTIQYIVYKLNIDDLQQNTDEEKEKIDNFFFTDEIDFLSIKNSKRSNVEAYDGYKWAINAGKEIPKHLQQIDNLLIGGGKLPTDIMLLLSKIRCSDFLQILSTILPNSIIKIDDNTYYSQYMDFYESLKKFSSLENELRQYVCSVENFSFRSATASEINDYINNQRKIRQEYPGIEKLYAELTKNKI